MAWWHSKRETGSPYERADALYDESIRLSRISGAEAEAEEAATAAVSAYRTLLGKTRGLEAKRRLAKALWRQSQMTGVLRNLPRAAMAAGEEGIALGRQVLEETSTEDPAFDATVRELAIALNDLAQLAAEAGDRPARERLLLDAVRVSQSSQGKAVRHALGVSLYNLAQHRFENLPLRAKQGSLTDADMRDVQELAEEAVDIRAKLCAEPGAEPFVFWELANAKSQLGRVLCMTGDRERGLQILAQAPAALSGLHGPSVDALREQLARELAFMTEMHTTLAREAPDENTAPSGLNPRAVVLRDLLCLLEATDRVEPLARLWFRDLWRARNPAEDIPDFDGALAELVEAGFVGVTGAPPNACYEVAEGLERSIRAQCAGPLTRAFLESIAARWAERFNLDQAQPGPLTVRAGIGATVYLRRMERFETAFELLETCVLGVACRTGESRYVLLNMLNTAQASGAAELLQRFDRAAEKLVAAHLAEGHADEALAAVRVVLSHATQCGLKPERMAAWHELSLQALYFTGQFTEVLQALPAALDAVERMTGCCGAASVHRSREDVLHHGIGAAKALNQWELALDLTTQLKQSLTARQAPLPDFVRCWLNEYAPLLELGHGDAADRVLQDCQQQVEAIQDQRLLAAVLGARGVVASRRGDVVSALSFKRSSLQKSYRSASSPDADLAAHAHDVYANELVRSNAAPDESAVHWLAAATLYGLRGNEVTRQRIVQNMRTFLAAAALSTPSTIEELAECVNRSVGVDFKGLLASMYHGRHDARAVLSEIARALERA